MVTFIEIISGVSSGSRYRVREGVSLGRSNADIRVDDPKVSGTHAKVEMDSRGQLVLMDLDSANGIYINDRRVKKVSLIPGVTFELGRTLFRVIQVAEEPTQAFEKVVTWRMAAKEGVSGMDVRNEKTLPVLLSFKPALRLVFVQGIQAGHEAFLGYGPRKAGAASLDIELLDESAPDQAFELSPGPDGQARIAIAHPDQVLLNNQAQSTETLKDGDLITFGNTVIRIAYA